MRRKRKMSRRYWIFLALVLVVCMLTGYGLILEVSVCGCTIPPYDETITAIFQSNVSIMTAIADTATAKALTPTPTLDLRTGTALSQMMTTPTAIGKIQTGTPIS